MRIKHIQRYLAFVKQHIETVVNRVNDIPPYNVVLEIIEDDSDTDTDWETLTDSIYNTLNIDSDDEQEKEEEHEIDPASFFDDISTPNEDIPEELEDGGDDEPTDSNNNTQDTCDQLIPAEPDPNASDEEELEVSEIEIDNIKYYTTDEYCGKIYHILANDQIGEKVGFFNHGVADFY